MVSSSAVNGIFSKMKTKAKKNLYLLSLQIIFETSDFIFDVSKC